MRTFISNSCWDQRLEIDLMEVRRVALMVSDFEDGGVERNFTHLASGLARLGIETWLLAGQARHPYLNDLDPAVRVAPIDGGRVPFLRGFLPRERPDLLLTGKLSDDFAAVQVRSDLGSAWPSQTRLVAAVGTLLSGRLDAHRWNLLKTWREVRRIRACYQQLDGITAISDGVADDLRRTFRIEGVPIGVLNNPILPEGHWRLAQAPCPHPWLAGVTPGCRLDGRPPVMLAIGGLRKVKDFATLIRAFARVEEPGARLLILGEGKERGPLTRLGRRLGLGDRLDLPGFVPSPYPYLARARLLALSSLREGLGNVVVESLAVGTPVVATDCSAGLRALFRERGLGPLVPVGDAAALARALDQGLRRSWDPAVLRAAAEPYGLLPAAQAHLDFFRGLGVSPRGP
jgi:glycosyltransferase involved in cell wall biosynthesis